jgi:predicted transcriptional regulator
MSALLSVRIDDATNAELSAIANQQHRTKTEVVKSALEFYFKKKHAKLANQMAILRAIDRDEDYIGEDI